MNAEKTPSSRRFAEWIPAAAFLLIILLCVTMCSGRGSISNGSRSSDSTALVACKRAARDRYVYGFNPSTLDTSITGMRDGSTRITFTDAKIGNAYGAQRTATVHCTYSGGRVTGLSE